MIINSSAPTRIDLAGGTLDIWPLYLFIPKARTINIAIDQRARVRLETMTGSAIEIISDDLGTQHRLPSIDYAEEVERGHPLELIIRLLNFFKPEGGMQIRTQAMSPKGAGLGGSSALCIALAAALNTLKNGFYSREELLTITKNIETQVLGVPAGVQDYYPALYGGLNSVLLEVMGESLLRHSHLLAHQLESQLVLVYSGISHNSGKNNWEITKAYLDKDQSVRDQLVGIQESAEELEYALKTGRYKDVALAMEREMSFRRKLFPEISPPELDKMIALGKEHGAIAAKVCGAGGGGCVVFWTEAKNRVLLQQKFRDQGNQVIDFHIDSVGLNVEAH